MGMSLGDMVFTVTAIDRASRVLGNVGNSVKKTQQETAGLSGTIQQMSPTLTKAGLALTGMGAAGAFAITQLARGGAEIRSLRGAFQRLGADAGLSLESLQEAAGGTVAEIDLIRAANRAMMLGLDPTVLPELMHHARAAAIAMGTSTTKAFDDIVTGIGRQSKMILDNLGIIVSLEAAYEDMAVTLGKNVGELTEAERKTAFMNAAMKAAQTNTERLGDIFGTEAEELSRFDAMMTDLRYELGEEVLPTFLEVVRVGTDTLAMLRQLPDPVRQAGIQFLIFSTAIGLTLGPLLLVIAQLPGAIMALKGFAAAASASSLAVLGPAGLIAALTGLGVYWAQVAAIDLTPLWADFMQGKISVDEYMASLERIAVRGPLEAIYTWIVKIGHATGEWLAAMGVPSWPFAERPSAQPPMVPTYYGQAGPPGYRTSALAGPGVVSPAPSGLTINTLNLTVQGTAAGETAKAILAELQQLQRREG